MSVPTITVRQARALDIKARELYGVSTLVLMENAGIAVAGEAVGTLRSRPKKVAIFCGKGNNGGDGFVAARHLLTLGIKPAVFLAGRTEDVKGEAGINLKILLNLKQKVCEVSARDLPRIKSKISGYALIIDALLGVGLSGEVRGIYRDLIGMINAAGAQVLAVDIPSGLDSDTGKVLGCCVKADTTVTFVAGKRGMARGAGPQVCGRIAVKDLGIPLKQLC